MHRRRHLAVWFGLSGWIGTLGCDPAFTGRFLAAFRAQLASSPDGKTCAEGSDFAALVPDCPFESVCFTSACAAHDACYGGCEAERGECDRQFREDMFAVCNEQFALDATGLRECLYFANLYWAIVDSAGDTYYNCEFVPTAPTPGACCTFGEPAVCEEVDSSAQCAFQSLFVADLNCKDVGETFGACPAPANDSCTTRIRVCQQAEADASLGRCASSEDAPPNLADRVCSAVSQDCAFGDPCLPYAGEAFRCIVNGDNRLADADGPDPGADCGFDDAGRFHADIWYEYVAPCTGTMTIQMCNGTFYDSILSVYGSGVLGECQCPADNATLLSCDDDSCGGFATSSVAGTPVVEGACYILRVGGYSNDATDAGAARGLSRLDIGVLCD